ncbi:hypothetical protein [Nocardia paucivorans]|uniref:hypothetical protein n=1 Tax=Nocardia paucivorans TaxID=114259 RepID=UPI0002E93084|nr:hypothetical protein [Nocardia paucivorans]
MLVLDTGIQQTLMDAAVVAAAASDPHGVLLIPCGAAPADAWATRRDTAPLSRRAVTLAPGGRLKSRLVSMDHDPRELITTGARELLAVADIAPFAAGGLQHRTAYPSALGLGLSVGEYEPRGQAAREVAELATETLEPHRDRMRTGRTSHR